MTSLVVALFCILNDVDYLNKKKVSIILSEISFQIILLMASNKMLDKLSLY
jgi:hypothetical protein